MKVLICILLLSTPAYAQEEKAADIFSYVTTGSAIALDSIHSFRDTDKKHAFLKQGERLAATVAISELTKFLIHRTRPDGSDNKSFFSEHTALTAEAGGWNIKIGIPLTIGTGSGRIIAKRHFVSDVMVGALVGGLAARYIR